MRGGGKAAAIVLSRQKNYGCESFYCDKEHLYKNGSSAGPGGMFVEKSVLRALPKRR